MATRMVAMCQKPISGVKVKEESHEVVTVLIVPERFCFTLKRKKKKSSQKDTLRFIRGIIIIVVT